ncbi:hypothetical protein XcodCFBP4690_05060 [Xanthomonas codiaei]|uniref:Uncharacterized protein n=1 Tax=Xanthomonas codiaei TaxID=56463 RepID=A0A2S7CUX7_9XANT|nr:hypothetical protein XcodCFBP4690_05060 [Xanthomonas codiaei]
MAASMPPHGPAPGRDTTLPTLPPLIGKRCFKHMLLSMDFVADVIDRPSVCSHVARNGRSEERVSSSDCSHFFPQPTPIGGACARTGVGP